MKENNVLSRSVRFAVGVVGLVICLSPTAALSQNECTPVGIDPSDNGAAADSFTCVGNFSATGITYDAAGDLVVQSTGAVNVGAFGINLTAGGADNIDVNASATVTGTAGTVLGVQTEAGDINITNAGITGSNPNVMRGLSAESIDGGSIDINHTAGTVNANSNAAGAQQQSAIRAVASGGNGDVSIMSAGTVLGRLRGIEAMVSGTGDLTITTTAGVSTNNQGAGIAAIDATAGAGRLVINIDPGAGVVNGFSGSAIRADASGELQINIARTVQASAAGWALDLSGGAQTEVNFNGPGMGARVDGRVRIQTDNFTLNNAPGSMWTLVSDGSELGAGVINNAGIIRFSTFGPLNAGQEAGSLQQTSDSFETIVAPGATFVGMGDSRLDMGVLFDGVGQESCGGALRADCIDLSGGTTSGQTSILVVGVVSTAVAGPLRTGTTANPGIVLVDVAGGTSASGHFVLSPLSTNYMEDAMYGAVLDFGGLIDYALLYNPDAQQHLLASVPGPEAVQYGTYIQQGLSMWHVTADAVLGRNSDSQRSATGKVWFRAVGEQNDRDAVLASTIHANDFSYSQGYSSFMGGGIFGFDAARGDDFVIGVHGGIVRSSTSFDNSATEDNLDGTTAGVYGSWWRDQLSVDVLANVTLLTLEHKLAELENTDSNIFSLGLRAEAGYLLPLAGEAFYVQPLLAAAYVQSSLDDLELKDNEVSFEGADSQRIGLGLRIGGDSTTAGGRFGYWLMAKAWNESAGDGEVRFATADGAPLVITDDLSGSFQEYGLGISVSNADDSLGAFLSGGAKTSDDTDSYNVSLGARMRW